MNLNEFKYPDTPLDQMILTRGEIMLLKKLKRTSLSTEKAISFLKLHLEKNTSPCLTLWCKGLIFKDNDNLKIIKRGENWLEFHRRNQIKDYYPSIISTIALIISIFALIK